MLLTVSKRLEFSASRRLFVQRWSETENLAAFGPETRARYGTGRNYVAYFVFAGPVNPTTGMLINISEIKSRAGNVIADRYDHKFLNQDNSSFAHVPPTAENIARQLFIDVTPLFSDVDAKLAGCHLIESPDRSATFYSDGAREANFWFEFSAARQTISPHLSKSENERLFGEAMSVHGHNYRARLTLAPQKLDAELPFVPHDKIENCIQSVRGALDHRFLNRDVPDLKNHPVTTESLAKYVYKRIHPLLPLNRIRLHEREDFFAEVWDEESVFLGMRTSLSAAHRLHVRAFSDEKNETLFGKCNNSLGHGHSYVTEATVGGTYDEKSGTLCDFMVLQNALKDSLAPWQNRHLDLETKDFRETPSTGENIVRALWPKIDNRIGNQLVRLRVWETPNNRFTLRRT